MMMMFYLYLHDPDVLAQSLSLILNRKLRVHFLVEEWNAMEIQGEEEEEKEKEKGNGDMFSFLKWGF